ncbi:GT-D fold domain-containing glycosyltransferase [Pediococcus pentosaceus]|uniref:GT-D fold domain-containing glycosyltransferase n=1 Tax=Pediococcus pentosaceus TaxID=1255 RepID=UPI0018A1A917|nr:GT-D fold domain-containing glycosyltransferase [Pediococcus pentosaceus]MBF7102885.1 DUF1792 domain-containing protein [Pediococcus pentosaceus]
MKNFIKKNIVLILYRIFLLEIKLKNKRIHVKNIKDSIINVKEKKLSVGRFGDGEFKWLYGKRENDNFEKNSKKIQNDLKRVISSRRNDFKVCIPDIFEGLDQYREKSKIFWAGQLIKHGNQWVKKLDSDYEYLDSLMTRPYMIYRDKNESRKLFDLFKSIWKQRNILIIEGRETRFGIGDDLLSNAKSVSRIICPSKNAFEKYEHILNITSEYVKNNRSKDLLVLASLGPTATILAHDLSLKESVQVIDIGHLDIEYYWSLIGARDKVKVPYKYVNEVKNGDKVEKLPVEYEKKYLSQVVNVIE